MKYFGLLQNQRLLAWNERMNFRRSALGLINRVNTSVRMDNEGSSVNVLATNRRYCKEGVLSQMEKNYKG